MKYAGVVIDTGSESIDKAFIYEAEGLDIRVGSCVTVEFRARPRSGIVTALHDELPDGVEESKLLRISELREDLSLTEEMVKTAAQMRRRYFTTMASALACFKAPGKDPARRASEASVGSGSQADKADKAKDPEYILTDEQGAAFSLISRALDAREYKVFLLHGVTGSGKTEVYMRAAEKALEAGGSVIVLVPEISLTPQTIARFTARFGKERIAVMHSKLAAGKRRSEWLRIAKGEADIVIGARLAVFAPVKNPALIIVDEEHENTYKSDKNPKYDAVEVAILRAHQSGATVILGSATPSLVSMYRAEQGIYELLTMKKRYNETPLPKTYLVDMRKELAAGNASAFSSALRAKMERSLAAGKKTILFLNRRGYAGFISCRSCGFVMLCPSCGISMTYHKDCSAVVCHYCGRSENLPEICPECGSPHIHTFGIGTQKVEEIARETFPAARVSRLDLDTGSRKGKASEILADFASGEADILVGTQMVAKGIDVSDVDPVGIISADVSLNIPDFRASERTYALITQAAGRAGRGGEQGSVYIQTYKPDAFAISCAAAGDFGAFYKREIAHREQLCYPPFSDIVLLTCYAKEESVAQEGAQSVKVKLIETIGAGESDRILGPSPAYIYTQDGDYRYCLYIKMNTEMRRVYEDVLTQLKRKINTDRGLPYRIMIDVNPY